MAAVTSTAATSPVVRTAIVHKPTLGASSPFVFDLPAMAKKGSRVRCSMEKQASPVQETRSKMGMSASLIAAACAATMSSSPAALALVDDRLSTEGTGLPFGLSNNLLVWILLGVFVLIWSFYTVYTSTLEEDEESELSL